MKQYKCPICGVDLASCVGSKMDPTDGVTVWCPNNDCKSPDGVPCQEVMGHGNNKEQAYEIIKEKYKVS